MLCAHSIQHGLRHSLACAAIAGIFLAVPHSGAQTTPQATPATKPAAKPAAKPAPKPAPKPAQPQDPAKDPKFLSEIGRVAGKIFQSVQFPPARPESRLLPLLPESTLVYTAFPNYGEVMHQALTIFRQERQESAILREWWQRPDVAADGAKVENAIDKFYLLSQYLGDELVGSGTSEGRDPRVLFVAEVRKPGLKPFLAQMISELSGKSRPTVHVYDPQELAALETPPAAEDLLVLVRPDLVAASSDLATLRGFNASLDRSAREFAPTPFGQRVVKAYGGGATSLIAADLHRILALILLLHPDTRKGLESTGFADVKYALLAHNIVAGHSLSQAELSFIGPRHGVAAWLASPAPLRSLDFVSPQALLVSSVLLASPPRIFDDVKALVTASSPNAFNSITQLEQGLNLSLRDDLFGQLGGEITLELDSLAPGAPAWRALFRVNDPAHLHKTISTLLAMINVAPQAFDSSGLNAYTITIPSGGATKEVDYAFVDGYWLLASSRDALAESVRLHASGESLAKSAKFLASLPPGYSADASGLFYQNAAAMAAAGLKQWAPELAGVISPAGGDSPSTVVAVYGEESLIREASSSAVFDTTSMLVVAAVAIPNLLRSRQAANEASAVGTVRTINVAEVTYSVTYPERGYSRDLSTLMSDPQHPGVGTADRADLLGDMQGEGDAPCRAGEWCTKSGYRFRIHSACTVRPCKSYVVAAVPVVAGQTGIRQFCSASDGVIRSNSAGTPLTWPLTATACKAWPPLQ